MPTTHDRAARDGERAVWLPLWRGDQAFYKVDIADDVSRITRRRSFDPAESMHCDFVELVGEVRSLERRIDHRSCARLHWLTHATNLDAMKLYDRIADKPGFVQYRKALWPRCGRR